MPVDTFERMLCHAPRADRLILQGLGEPTLHPQLRRFIEISQSSRKYDQIGFNTNGLAITAGEFSDLSIDFVNISIDSLVPDTAAVLRSGTDCIRLRGALVNLCREFHDSVTVSVVLSRRNMSELSSLLADVYELGARHVEVQPMISYDGDSNGLCLTGDQLAHIADQTNASALPGLHVGFAPAMVPTGKRCLRPLLSAYVTARGFVTPCCMTEDESLYGFANLKDTPFADIWAATAVQTWLTSYRQNEPQLCRRCPFNPAGVK